MKKTYSFNSNMKKQSTKINVSFCYTNTASMHCTTKSYLRIEYKRAATAVTHAL
jgi:hypothetical protein